MDTDSKFLKFLDFFADIKREHEIKKFKVEKIKSGIQVSFKAHKIPQNHFDAFEPQDVKSYSIHLEV